MQLIPSSQCDKSLLSPFKNYWPGQVPGVSVNGLVLIGFEQELFFNHQMSELAPNDIASLYQSLYPQLTFIELAYLFIKGKTWFPFPQICQNTNLHWTEIESELSHFLLESPLSFQNWCYEKRVFPNDLKPLLLLPSQQKQTFFQLYPTFSFSKSEGCEYVELTADLLSLHSVEKIEACIKSGSDANSVLKNLRKLRYPMTTDQDESMQNQISQIPKSSLQKIRWVRQGDQSGLEIKFFVSHPKDLNQHQKALKELEQSLTELKSLPWKIN